MHKEASAQWDGILNLSRSCPHASLSPGLHSRHPWDSREVGDELSGILANGAVEDRLATALEQQQLVKGLWHRATNTSSYFTKSSFLLLSIYTVPPGALSGSSSLQARPAQCSTAQPPTPTNIRYRDGAKILFLLTRKMSSEGWWMVHTTYRGGSQGSHACQGQQRSVSSSSTHANSRAECRAVLTECSWHATETHSQHPRHSMAMPNGEREREREIRRA